VKRLWAWLLSWLAPIPPEEPDYKPQSWKPLAWRDDAFPRPDERSLFGQIRYVRDGEIGGMPRYVFEGETE
jgi:hypothetical protein